MLPVHQLQHCFYKSHEIDDSQLETCRSPLSANYSRVFVDFENRHQEAFCIVEDVDTPLNFFWRNESGQFLYNYYHLLHFSNLNNSNKSGGLENERSKGFTNTLISLIYSGHFIYKSRGRYSGASRQVSVLRKADMGVESLGAVSCYFNSSGEEAEDSHGPTVINVHKYSKMIAL